MKTNIVAPRHRSRSLLVAVSLSMVPIVYPVLHAHIFSYLFIIYVITHAWTSPEILPRSRVLVLFGHYACSSTLSTSLSHTHVNRSAHTHTYVHRRTKLMRSSSVEEIGFLRWLVSFARKWERIGRSVVIVFFFCFFFESTPSSLHSLVFTKNHMCCVVDVG